MFFKLLKSVEFTKTGVAVFILSNVNHFKLEKFFNLIKNSLESICGNQCKVCLDSTSQWPMNTFLKLYKRMFFPSAFTNNCRLCKLSIQNHRLTFTPSSSKEQMRRLNTCSTSSSDLYLLPTQPCFSRAKFMGHITLTCIRESSY